MELQINLKLLIIFSYLLIAFHSTKSHLSPGPGVSPTLHPKSAPSSGPSPATKIPSNTVSFPPSISDPPSESISPNTNEPELDETESDELELNDPEPKGPFNIDFSTMLNSAEVEPKVKEICDATDHPPLCLSTVLPLLKGKADVSSVLEVSITAGNKFAEYALSLAKSYAEKPETPPEVVAILNDCKDSYDTALYNFEKAIGAFPEKDIGTMNSVLSAVITDVGDCEDAFVGLGKESPLSSYAEKLTNMASNCLAIISLMK